LIFADDFLVNKLIQDTSKKTDPALASGFSGRGVASMDAGAKPTGTYLRRPLEEHPDTKANSTRGVKKQTNQNKLKPDQVPQPTTAQAH
jgi:hypothetical protein